jgi:hypothetical protein
MNEHNELDELFSWLAKKKPEVVNRIPQEPGKLKKRPHDGWTHDDHLNQAFFHHHRYLDARNRGQHTLAGLHRRSRNREMDWFLRKAPQEHLQALDVDKVRRFLDEANVVRPTIAGILAQKRKRKKRNVLASLMTGGMVKGDQANAGGVTPVITNPKLDELNRKIIAFARRKKKAKIGGRTEVDTKPKLLPDISASGEFPKLTEAQSRQYELCLAAIGRLNGHVQSKARAAVKTIRRIKRQANMSGGPE